ncbi:hypothetical protein [Stutzerimonas nitrititolerans]|uniref:hypothetical protein n=1 Tax=Stutzerimonas nitrititolerans TaxID=2482751 RepID=UPI0028ACD2AA|nr:hypothetical protein [Stutzerimonas nitrititolerans]
MQGPVSSAAFGWSVRTATITEAFRGVAGPAEPGVEDNVVLVHDQNEMFLVNRDTGEITLSIKTASKETLVRRDVKCYVGIDTRFPGEARDAEELMEALSVHDHWGNQLHFEAYNVLQLLDVGISGDAVRIFTFIAERLAGRNYWYGRLEDLDDQLGLSERTRKRAVKELVDANLMQVDPQGRGRPTKVSVHPWYAYRGDIAGIEPALKDWVALHRRRSLGLEVPNLTP